MMYVCYPVLSHEALEANESKLSRAEKLLKLAEFTRKMETERERVMPFYVSRITDEDMTEDEYRTKAAALAKTKLMEATSAVTGAGGGDGNATTTGESDAKKKEPSKSGKVLSVPEEEWMTPGLTNEGRPVEDWQHLNNFHKKFNKVLLDKFSISQEKQRLQQENQDLRGILKQFLDGITVTEDVVDSANALLIVNGRVNLLDQERRVQRMDGRNRTVVEATQVITSYGVQANIRG